jgi:hypothetical protein
VFGAAAGLLVAGVEVVGLLDVDLLLLPPPAKNTPPAMPTANAVPASATTSHVDSFPIIDPSVVGQDVRRPALQPFGIP